MRDIKIAKEIEYYNNLPVVFEDFVDLPELKDNKISLECYEKNPAIPEKKWVPNYWFNIVLDGENVGRVNLRIGYTEGLYYGGQVGYWVDEAFWGQGFAVRACRLMAEVAKMHGMVKLIISNDENNKASKRVCEKLGAKLIRTTDVPKWHDLYTALGIQRINIFEWDI